MWPLLSLLLSLPALLLHAATPPHTPVEITRFDAPSGRLRPGDSALASVTLRFSGTDPLMVWIDYSVRAPDGTWNHVVSHPVRLDPGQELPPQQKVWVLPDGTAPGRYDVAVSVWSAPPEEGDAVRLAAVEQRRAFEARTASLSRRFRPGGWHSGDHPLGRGRVRPDLVVPGGGGVRIRLEKGSCDGGEIRTDARFLHGEYRIRMRTPYAPGSISAFFLYEDVEGGNDEIDLEILNDGTGRMILSAWVDGEQTQEAVVDLPSDPAADFHEYAIHFQPGDLRFLVNGQEYARWAEGLPSRPMRVLANAWWPTWLDCPTRGRDRYMEIDWIRLQPIE